MQELYSSAGYSISWLKGKIKKDAAIKTDSQKPFLLVVNVKGAGLFLRNRDGSAVSLFSKADTCNLFFLSPGSGLFSKTGGDAELFVVQFTGDALYRLAAADKALQGRLRKMSKSTTSVSFLETPIFTHRLVKAALYEVIQNTGYQPAITDLLIQAAVLKVWAHFWHHQSLPADSESFRMKERVIAEKAKAFLDEQQDRNGYTIITLAEELGTNETTLKQAFRKLTGTSLYKYYNDKRMDKAQILLKEGFSITETAMRVGFKSIAHFSHSYKKQFGVTPGSVF